MMLDMARSEGGVQPLAFAYPDGFLSSQGLEEDKEEWRTSLRMKC